ncbi:hypothetical protein E2C01_055527 [Portunus trituberculatus]|uniref:Uncharacterized protein n=1 Tax=Portunus trituberculatus TaxID=210409 RepID=A0A5B7GVR0_PORTR|nr:hypothetical protein [Portunus trituberculatus]
MSGSSFRRRVHTHSRLLAHKLAAPTRSTRAISPAPPKATRVFKRLVTPSCWRVRSEFSQAHRFARGFTSILGLMLLLLLLFLLSFLLFLLPPSLTSLTEWNIRDPLRITSNAGQSSLPPGLNMPPQLSLSFLLLNQVCLVLPKLPRSCDPSCLLLHLPPPSTSPCLLRLISVPNPTSNPPHYACLSLQSPLSELQSPFPTPPPHFLPASPSFPLSVSVSPCFPLSVYLTQYKLPCHSENPVFPPALYSYMYWPSHSSRSL